MLYFNPLKDILGIGGPSIIEKAEMLFTDVETEGKKNGYSRAASEYETVYCSLKQLYKKTINQIEMQYQESKAHTDILLQVYEDLEKERKNLEKKTVKKTREVSDKYNIPVSEVQKSLSSGFWGDDSTSLDISDILYYYKKDKMKKAEQQGYLEAKELYEEKIDKLKKEFAKREKELSLDRDNMKQLVSDILSAIAEEKMKIAELEIVLEG